MSKRERRELAWETLFSTVDDEVQNQCWDCKKASVVINKEWAMVAVKDKSNNEMKDKAGNVIKEKVTWLERQIHCEHYNALIEKFTYHCERFQPLEDE